ncbi:MAG: molybdopterin molybdotransferase MoeA, partial [bacterium]|nr:molybdopterin molybdotransferase MoeA [bacterium]
GAPLPLGADAVLPAEQATESNAVVTLHGESTPEKHVGRVGEDVEQGATVLSAGRVLRPQDIGVLASIGKSSVSVCRQPRVRILITGNELLTAGASPQTGHIFDANGPMLRGLVERDGGLPIFPGIVPDDPDAIAEQLQTDYDIALVSGGSSVGKEDYAPRLVSELGSLPIHGVAMRPSSPAGMGLIQNKLVILLPGNPVSCLCAYDFFAGRAIRQLGGRSAAWPYRRTKTRLSRKLVSTVGRVDYARVKFVNNEAEPIAISGASILTSTTRADGFVIIEEDSEGYPGGAEVTVWRYDV